MEDSASFKIGEVAGAVMALVLMLGLVVFFIVALVKAFTTRRTGWIIAASLSSLPLVFILVCFCIGFVIGLRQGMNHSANVTTSRGDETSELLTAMMSPVPGNVLPYEISLPMSSAWRKDNSQPPFDYLFSYHDAYVGVIAEGFGSQNPQNMCGLSQKNVADKASKYSFTTPEPIEIDSHSWLTYDATATVSGINFKYRFYVYGDTNYSFQIISWTGPILFDNDAPLFDRVAKSFKMPK
jgi:hypothetical protein